MFSEAFFYGLVILGLIWTALGVVTLVVMLVRDWKKGELW